MFRSTTWPRGAGPGGDRAITDMRLPKWPKRGRVADDAGPSAWINAAGLTPELSRAEGVGLNEMLGLDYEARSRAQRLAVDQRSQKLLKTTQT